MRLRVPDPPSPPHDVPQRPILLYQERICAAYTPTWNVEIGLSIRRPTPGVSYRRCIVVAGNFFFVARGSDAHGDPNP